MSKIVTRFAPSPTGFLHIGGVRSALFNYLFSKQNGGKSLLRIEDTDKSRNREEWTIGLIEDLKWLRFVYDNCEKQSDRLEIHKKYLLKLIENGDAYVSKETPTEPGQRDEVIRFKNPNKKITFKDIIRDEVTFDTTELGDFIIARSMEEPLYHLAVVVDDFEMGISHVIRAEEHLSNTPRQILIQEAIGAPRPEYAHLPLVLAPDKSKLSKRKHGETVSLSYYRQKGYLPEALINFIALLGWNPGTNEEIFSLEELIKNFNLEKIQKGGAVFNVEKLNWFNKEYLKKIPREISKREVESRFGSEISDSLFNIIFERINVWSDVDNLLAMGEFDFCRKEPEYDAEKLVWKKSTKEDTVKNLLETQEILSKIQDNEFNSESIKKALWDFAEKNGRGNVLWPLRFALSGKEKSPDPFLMAEIIGKTKTISRVVHALKILA